MLEYEQGPFDGGRLLCSPDDLSSLMIEDGIVVDYWSGVCSLLLYRYHAECWGKLPDGTHYVEMLCDGWFYAGG